MTVYAKSSTGRQKMTPKSSQFPLVGGVRTADRPTGRPAGRSSVLGPRSETETETGPRTAVRIHKTAEGTKILFVQGSGVGWPTPAPRTVILLG